LTADIIGKLLASMRGGCRYTGFFETVGVFATVGLDKRAIAECSRIDECQTWADKAEAMASYAKQSKDDSLRKMADRIQARAIRRCGELLKQIEPAKGGHWETKRVGAHPSILKPNERQFPDRDISYRLMRIVAD
jgi:hypothetical protein